VQESLDAEKIRVLGQWAEGLQRDARQELAAAGRAISMLVEEVERLHVLLWGKRLYPESDVAPEAVPEQPEPEREPEPEPDAAAAPGELVPSLLRRLTRRRVASTGER
jgi:hypothetical protein